MDPLVGGGGRLSAERIICLRGSPYERAAMAGDSVAVEYDFTTEGNEVDALVGIAFWEGDSRGETGGDGRTSRGECECSVSAAWCSLRVESSSSENAVHWRESAHAYMTPQNHSSQCER
jgi:hypothetical protein